MAFLRELLKHSIDNNLNANLLGESDFLKCQQTANIQVRYCCISSCTSSPATLFASLLVRPPPNLAGKQTSTRPSESQPLHTGVPNGRRWRLKKRTTEQGVMPSHRGVQVEQKDTWGVCGWSSGRYLGHPALRWLTASVMKVWHCWIVPVLHRHCPLVTFRYSSVPSSEE